ncbi:MucB/RseB C-terminal domain-containing protein [Xylophilus sp. Leaf220]|uniref:MucB/RseB C-terminal domain-containing protein n=1 Tax=Xylophilus sp. Leaf220 TaxID=1735686 RepID=UPI0006FF0CD9|nr:MucB/RseB C-terminal domain-containing protein [Xylophilus sp. Leaf220]KQM68321.1 transcriptional regulator [Xylophilus sp. Leaf220]
MSRRVVRRAGWAVACLAATYWPAAFAAAPAAAEVGPSSQSAPAAPAPAPPAAAEVDVLPWLVRTHEASKNRTYAGTLVVLSANGALSSSRIWHACKGEQRVERIESLTGAPRSSFRRNDEVVTFLPELHVARSERRDSFGLFPNLLRVGDAAVRESYGARPLGSQRVAGMDTEVVQVQPRDASRYGYRLWMDKASGLTVQLQTLDGTGRVLEQAAFSELQLDAPVPMDKIVRMMSNTGDYKVEKLDVTRTTAEAEGWALAQPVAGFRPLNCLRRSAPTKTNTVQWVFSDGLATVSLFIEPYGAQPRAESQMAVGVTQMLSRRVSGDWWVTAVGEVPLQTLQTMVQSLERRR